MQRMRSESRKKSVDSLREEQRLLQEQERELKRREEELSRRLKKLPTEVKERQRREMKFQQLNSVTVAQGGWTAHRLSRREKVGSRRALRSEQRAARAKFLVLCLILAAMVILLLRAIPN